MANNCNPQKNGGTAEMKKYRTKTSISTVKKQLLSAVLIGSILVASVVGCSGSDNNKAAGGSSDKNSTRDSSDKSSASKDGNEENKENSKQDSTKKWEYAENIIAVIDGQEVTKEDAAFYLYCQQANYEAYYLAYYGDEIDWQQADGDNVTVEETVKTQVLEDIQKKVILCKYAGEHDISLTEKEHTEVKEKVQTFLQDSDEKILEASGANEELVTRLYTQNALYEKTYEVIAGKYDIKVTEEEVKQAKITAVELASTEDNEKTIKQLKADADAILKMTESGQTLSVVAKAYGYEATTGNVGKGDMNENDLEKACLAMKTGEYQILAFSEYYYVLYCDMEYDEEATQIAKEELEKQKKDEKVTEFYEELIQDKQIEINSAEWDKMKFEETIFTMEDMEKVE